MEKVGKGAQLVVLSKLIKGYALLDNGGPKQEMPCYRHPRVAGLCIAAHKVGIYSISHERSGLNLFSFHFSRLEDALRYMLACAPLADWTQLTRTEDPILTTHVRWLHETFLDEVDARASRDA